MDEEEIITSCPDCGAAWSMDEMDWECCFSCGFPNKEDNEAELNDFDYE